MKYVECVLFLFKIGLVCDQFAVLPSTLSMTNTGPGRPVLRAAAPCSAAAPAALLSGRATMWVSSKSCRHRKTKLAQ
jgi:hypothetical protein